MSTVTKWIKSGNVHDFVFLGKEVIATTCGNHVIFYNIITNEERIEYFNDAKRGKGASCLAGHPIIPMFSTAERSYNPKIYIHTYPDIRQVAKCKLDKNLHSYISCTFAGTEYLLSLTSYSNYQLIVWLWRTGEKITYVDTMFSDDIQTIEASLNLSHLVYQFAPTLGRLLIYEIYSYSKKVTILKNTVDLIKNKITCVSWANNGTLLVSDEYENVYIVSSDGKKVDNILRGTIADNVTNHTLIIPFSNGLVVANNIFNLTYYTKSSLDENWIPSWSIKCPSRPLKITVTRHEEAILLYSESGQIFQLPLPIDNNPELKELYNNYPKIKFISLLEPHETHLVFVNNFNCVMVMKMLDGSIGASIQINEKDEVIHMVTHPTVPLVILSSSTGKCMCFVVSETKLNLVKSIYLQRLPLEICKFSKNGSLLGLSSISSNIIFFVRTIIDQDIEVSSHIELDKSPIDFLIYESKNNFNLLVLVKTSSLARVGNCIEIYSFNELENSFHKKHDIYMQHFYQMLTYGLDNVCDFLGSPYLSKKLHFFQIEDNYDTLQLTNVTSSNHNLRKFGINVTKRYLITSCYDGCIILRKYSNLSKIALSFMVHHYQDGGTKQSLVSGCGNVIVSLGRNGSIVGLESRQIEEDDAVLSDNNLSNIENYLWQNISISNNNNCENKTWLETQQVNILQTEINQSITMKNIILEDLKGIKSKIKQLLDTNETKNVHSKLLVSNFDLNKSKREEKINYSLREQKENEAILQKTINQNEKVIDYLMQNFWDVLEVHDCTLISFNSKTYVSSYSLRRMEKIEKMDDYAIELFSTPLLNEDTKLSDNNEHQFIFEQSHTEKNDSEKLIDDVYLKYSNDIVFTGTISSEWIKNDLPPNQLSKVTFDGTSYDFITSRENKLKMYYNEKFKEIKLQKSQVMDDITNRLKQLNKCKSELRDIFGIITEDDAYCNIKWHPVESPENAITISEEDITPELHDYIELSNIEQNQSNTMSEIKRSSFEDYEYTFRQEKLKEMMDGLLEIRWEDEIRREIPKPTCLLFKNPTKYDEEDKKAIAVYTEKINKLQAERIKYKTYLETEMQNINDQIKVDIENFDKKLDEFALEKIKIQSSILQEYLLRLNERKSQLVKSNGNRKIYFIVNVDLVELENEYKMLTTELSNIEPVVAELKSRYESLNKRDKLLEGKFRSEFVDLKQPMVEHLLRQYKRRPRIGQITCTSLTCLTETNKCLIAGKKSAILPREYLDFLRGMDALDVMPNNLPQQIDVNHWQSLCKLRRNKVEMEIKLRISTLELAEAEQTYFYLQKLSSSMQNKIYFMKNSVDEETLKQSKILNNPDVQLVLKSAQIEIAYTGKLNDYENATIVTYKKLSDLNNEILDEGENKITAMRALVKLRKSILYRKWKYQSMVKKLKHWKDHLNMLQKTKIGKEMQKYLVERLEEKHRYRDSTCDKMLISVQKKFERMLNEEKTGLLKIIDEIKYWRKTNTELITRIELYSLKREKLTLNLDEDYIQKRNRIFKKNYILSIMERTKLVDKVKESANELFNLQTQLELLKLKTYPTLRFKGYGIYNLRKSN